MTGQSGHLAVSVPAIRGFLQRRHRQDDAGSLADGRPVAVCARIWSRKSASGRASPADTPVDPFWRSSSTSGGRQLPKRRDGGQNFSRTGAEAPGRSSPIFTSRSRSVLIDHCAISSGSDQGAREVGEVVGQSMQLQPHGIGLEAVDRKPRPRYGVLAFLDPLLCGAANHGRLRTGMSHTGMSQLAQSHGSRYWISLASSPDGIGGSWQPDGLQRIRPIEKAR
jgi:hypothetical protein